MLDSQHQKSHINRRFIAVDLENITQSAKPSLATSRREICKIREILDIKPSDLVVVAGSCGNALVVGEAATELHGQARCRKGKDGADLALLDDLYNLPKTCVRSRRSPITEIVIASGDHIFSRHVKVLRKSGIYTTVISYRESLSQALFEACDRVIYLDVNELQEQAA